MFQLLTILFCWTELKTDPYDPLTPTGPNDWLKFVNRSLKLVIRGPDDKNDEKADFGSAGWGFESLQARSPVKRIDVPEARHHPFSPLCPSKLPCVTNRI